MEIHWTIIVGLVTIIAWFWFLHLKMARPMQQTEVATINRDQQTKIAAINVGQQTEVATFDGDQRTEVAPKDKDQQTEITTVDRDQLTEVFTNDKDQQTELVTVDRDQQTYIAAVELTKETPGLDVNSDSVNDLKEDIEKLESSSKAAMFATILKKYGYLGLQEILQEQLSNWKKVKLDIAVIGRSGVGKSTFINTFLKTKKAKTGSIETTSTCKSYPHPEHETLILWDIPGVGTRSFPKEKYLEQIDFQRYDFFLLLLSERVEEHDLWLIDCIFKVEKKAYIIRSKTDQAIANGCHDYPESSSEEVYDMIKDDMVEQFLSTHIDASYIYRICGQDENLFEFKLLISTIVRETPDLKRSAMTLCVSTVSDEMITAKVEVLRKRIYKISLEASLGATIPIPGAGILVQVSLLYDEAQFYRKQLGTDENTMKKIAARLKTPVEQLQKQLNMKMHIILRTKTAFAAFLGTLAATKGIESVLKIAIPIIGSIIAAGANYPLCVYSLRKILSEIEKEARNLNTYFAQWIKNETRV